MYKLTKEHTTDTSAVRPHVAALGEILWDVYPSGKQLGGAPANFIYYASRMRTRSHMISCIGRDKLGQEIIAVLQEAGISSEFIGEDERHPTGTVQVSVASDGQPLFTIAKNAAWDFLEWREDLDRLAVAVDAVCFGTLGQRSPKARRTIQKFLRATQKKCVRILDVNLRQDYFSRDIIQSSLETATIVKLNEAELNIITELFWGEKSEPVSLSRLLDNFSLELVALTRGERGSLLVSQQGSCEHPGFPVNAVDTVGAGDAFTAALTVGCLKAWDLDKISRIANLVASQVCLHQGAWTPSELFVHDQKAKD